MLGEAWDRTGKRRHKADMSKGVNASNSSYTVPLITSTGCSKASSVLAAGTEAAEGLMAWWITLNISSALRPSQSNADTIIG
jgi:hypothetical protein